MMAGVCFLSLSTRANSTADHGANNLREATISIKDFVPHPFGENTSTPSAKPKISFTEAQAAAEGTWLYSKCADAVVIKNGTNSKIFYTSKDGRAQPGATFKFTDQVSAQTPEAAKTEEGEPASVIKVTDRPAPFLVQISMPNGGSVCTEILRVTQVDGKLAIASEYVVHQERSTPTPVVNTTLTPVQPQVTQPKPVVSQPKPISARPATNDFEAQFMSWLNGVRERSGLKAIGINADSRNVSIQNNNSQSRSNSIGHFNLPRAGVQNSAMRNSNSVEALEAMWWNSGAHRANLMNPSIKNGSVVCSGVWCTFTATMY